MRTAVLLPTLAVCLFAISLTASAASIDYTTPGSYTVPANCGFTVLSSTNGWIRMSLSNDTGSSDLLVRAGEDYPLSLREVTIYAAAAGGAQIRVDTTPGCVCKVPLDPAAAAGICYTRSLGADSCEEDSSRPEIADADLMPPGPNLGLLNVGFYGSGQGDIDYLGWRQGDSGEYWQTARLREGEWNLGGARRCRSVDGSADTYITLIAP